MRPIVLSFSSAPCFGFILLALNKINPKVMKNATPNYYLDGVQTPLRVPTRITGIILALLLKTTNGQLTSPIALLLKFMDTKMKKATMQSSQVNQEKSDSPDPTIITAEIKTAQIYCIIRIKETLSLRVLSLNRTSYRCA